MAAGQSGMATSTDGDTDIAFLPSASSSDPSTSAATTARRPWHRRRRAQFQGPIVITGGEGVDNLLAAPSERLDRRRTRLRHARPAGGNDRPRAGPATTRSGAVAVPTRSRAAPACDTMNGSDGDERLAADDEPSPPSTAAVAVDTAYIDTASIREPITVENVIGDDAPPPPATDLHVRPRDEVCEGDRSRLATAATSSVPARIQSDAAGRVRRSRPPRTPTRSSSTAPRARSRA